jgi:hypothetical protein
MRSSVRSRLAPPCFSLIFSTTSSLVENFVPFLYLRLTERGIWLTVASVVMASSCTRDTPGIANIAGTGFGDDAAAIVSLPGAVAQQCDSRRTDGVFTGREIAAENWLFWVPAPDTQPIFTRQVADLAHRWRLYSCHLHGRFVFLRLRAITAMTHDHGDFLLTLQLQWTRFFQGNL